MSASTKFYVSSPVLEVSNSQSTRTLSFSSSNLANYICVESTLPAPGIASSCICSGVNSSSFPTLNPKWHENVTLAIRKIMTFCICLLLWVYCPTFRKEPTGQVCGAQMLLAQGEKELILVALLNEMVMSCSLEDSFVLDWCYRVRQCIPFWYCARNEWEFIAIFIRWYRTICCRCMSKVPSGRAQSRPHRNGEATSNICMKVG